MVGLVSNQIQSCHVFVDWKGVAGSGISGNLVAGNCNICAHCICRVGAKGLLGTKTLLGGLLALLLGARMLLGAF